MEGNSDGFIFTPIEYVPNEIWDVLDENHNLTGRYIERGRPWREGNYHLAVHAWKRNNMGERLIDKRTPRESDNLGGNWETTGGSARILNFKHMDHEGYAFAEPEIPYTNERSRDEQTKLMLADIEKSRGFFLSAVTGDFGEEIESLYDLAVYLEALPKIRLDRIEAGK